MKTIGILGGMSWESTAEYYRLLNEGVKARLGGLHSARCLVYSVDFADVERLQSEGAWTVADRFLVEAALRLERGGADFIVLATNTMHKSAPALEAALRVPLLHIADAAADAVKAAGLSRIGLLGTRFTMEESFYSGRLEARHGLEVLVPDAADRAAVNRVIYEELVLGKILASSRETYRRVIAGLAERGAEGIVLGCTEIGLLVKAEDSSVPVFDTTKIHAEAAVALSLLNN